MTTCGRTCIVLHYQSASFSLLPFAFSLLPCDTISPREPAMKKMTPLLIFAAVVLVAVTFTSRAVQSRALQVKPAPAPAKGFTIRQDAKAGTIAVFRSGGRTALVTQNARSDERPYLHPVVAPDGRGVLTEDKPAHHPHQTGLYWGFTRVNG